MATHQRNPDPIKPDPTEPDPADSDPADDRVYLEEYSLVEPAPDAIAEFGDETQRNEALTTEEGLQQDHFVEADDENAV